MKYEVPIWEKAKLTLEEAAAYNKTDNLVHNGYLLRHRLKQS